MFFIDLDRESTEKFDMGKFFEWDQNGSGTLDVLGSFFYSELLDLEVQGVLAITSQERRPDLISYDVYEGDWQFWWVLLLYNAVLFVKDLTAGTDIEYPSLEDLEALYYQLKALEVASL